MSRLCWTLAGFTAFSFHLAAADCTPMAVSSAFRYRGKPIHPSCIRDLVTEPNGDNIAASVNLGRTPERGCMDSNRYATEAAPSADGFLEYQQPGSGSTFGYRHVREIVPGVHYLQIRQSGEGTFRSQSSLIVRYHADPVFNIDALSAAVKYVDRLTTVGVSEKPRADPSSDEYASIRAKLRSSATATRFCPASPER